MDGDGTNYRVVVVDDAGSTRRLLRAVLDESGEFEVVGEADDGISAVEVTEAVKPDVVLLDLSMPGGSATTVLAGLLRVAPDVAVIVLSGRYEAEAAPLLAQGAKAFVQKGLAPNKLIDRLREILGEPAAAPAMRPPVSRSSAAPSGAMLDGALRAVVCDDDPMTRRLVGQILKTCGVNVVAETDVVPTLVAVVEVAQPDIVVLDLFLEHTTGLTALPELRSVSSRSKVVVYSGQPLWREQAMAAGAVAFVDKPELQELMTTIRQVIGGRVASH